MTAADWHDHSVAFLMGKAVEAASAFTDEEAMNRSPTPSPSRAGPGAPGDDGGTGFESGEGVRGVVRGGRGAATRWEPRWRRTRTRKLDVGGGVIGATTTSSSSSSTVDPATPSLRPILERPAPTPPRTEVYYFYQAEDGQPVVLPRRVRSGAARAPRFVRRPPADPRGAGGGAGAAHAGRGHQGVAPRTSATFR